MNWARKQGFTIIEIMLVIGIIGTLAGIVIGAVNPSAQLASAKDAKRRSDARSLQNAIDQYLIDTGTLPSEINWPETGSMMICKETASDPTCISMDTLVPDYLSAIPVDEAALNSAHTGYTVKKDANDRPTVTTAFIENGQNTSPNDYVARWVFEDGPGSNTVTDVSGHGYSASLVNMDAGTDWVTDSEYDSGYALNFDGSNDYLTITNGEITLNDDFALFAAFNLQNLRNGAYRTLFSGGTNSTHVVFTSTDALAMRSNPGGTLSFDVFTGVDTGLHTIVMQRIGSTLYVYYDGALQATTRSSTRDFTIKRIAMDGLSTVGGNDNGGGNFYQMRVYDRALSQEEITALNDGL